MRKKPDVLGGGLKTKGKIQLDQAAALSLASCGFYLVPTDQDSYDLISTDGEVHVGMKDGVQYVLRFGTIAGTEAVKKKEEKKDGAKKSLRRKTKRPPETRRTRSLERPASTATSSSWPNSIPV